MNIAVETHSAGQTTALGTAGMRTIAVDLPVDTGGAGRGCTAEELLCFSVAAALSNGLHQRAQRQRLELTRVVVRVRGDFADEAPNAAPRTEEALLSQLEYDVEIHANALPDRVRALLREVDETATIVRLLRRVADVRLGRVTVRADFPTTTIEDVLAVCRFMAQEWTGPWWVGGGWAIDLWAGSKSRTHEDVEICVPRTDQARLQALVADWQWVTPKEGRWTPMAAGDLLQPPAFMWQLRRGPHTRERGDGMPARWEFLLTDVEDGCWVFPRDPSLRLPLDRVVIRSALGPPVVAPELVLLLKAFNRTPGGTQPRPKDEHDFLWARERFTTDQRTWLRAQLERLSPGHRWIAAL